MIDTIETWLRNAADRLHEEAPRLTALDQAIGDGDHGINLDRGFQAIVKALDARQPAEPGGGTEPSSEPAAAGDVLKLAGRTLISTVGGASGPLFGTAFLRAAASTAQAPSDVGGGALVALGLEAAATGVSALGKATTGEKTMLDALVPASLAARSAVDSGGDARAVVAAAREAAAEGAAATIPLLATKGRASYLGERSIGHQDPGATSVSILLDVLAASLA